MFYWIFYYKQKFDGKMTFLWTTNIHKYKKFHKCYLACFHKFGKRLSLLLGQHSRWLSSWFSTLNLLFKNLLGSLNGISVDLRCISCSIAQKTLRGVTSPTLYIQDILFHYYFYVLVLLHNGTRTVLNVRKKGAIIIIIYLL